MILLRRLSSCVVVLCLFACAQQPNRATIGGLTGGGIGAGLGAIIGNQTGHPGAGTAIGGAIGAVSGALVGNALDASANANEANQQQIDRNEAQIRENQRLIDELRRRGVDVHETKRGVVMNLPDVLFEFNKYDLTPEARHMVGEIANTLSTIKDRTIAVEGHTDSVGTVTYNKELSVHRAQTVARALEDNGLSHGQMTVHGYGEGRPVATNNTADGRARNRRVEVIVENART